MNTQQYTPAPERFSYGPWRHGGWYVYGIPYASGCSGCVSRNYPDKKWRIVCDKRFMAHDMHTYKNRDAAARAEFMVAQDLASGYLCGKCGHYFEPGSDYCGLCGHDLTDQKKGY